MWAGGGGSEGHTNGGSTVREDFEAQVAGREDARNGDMMYSGDFEVEGSGAAGAQGSGDTGRSYGMRVEAAPAYRLGEDTWEDTGVEQ